MCRNGLRGANFVPSVSWRPRTIRAARSSSRSRGAESRRSVADEDPRRSAERAARTLARLGEGRTHRGAHRGSAGEVPVHRAHERLGGRILDHVEGADHRARPRREERGLGAERVLLAADGVSGRLAAAQRDDKLFGKSKNNRQRRKVNMSEMTESDYFDYGYIDGGEDFAEYDINVMSRNGRKGSEDAMRNYPTEFIPRRVWSELPKEYRDLITDYREKKKNESKSAKSFQANQTIMEDTVDDGVDEEPLDEDSNNQLELNETQLLACLANQKTAPKGTLLKLLNDSHSKKTKKKVNTVVQKESKYVTIDGVKYIREVNVTNVNYKISNRDFKIQKLVH